MIYVNLSPRVVRSLPDHHHRNEGGDTDEDAGMVSNERVMLRVALRQIKRIGSEPAKSD